MKNNKFLLSLGSLTIKYRYVDLDVFICHSILNYEMFIDRVGYKVADNPTI